MSDHLMINRLKDLDILSSKFIDQIPLIVVGFDPEGRILHWNECAKNVTGYTKKDAARRGLPLFLRLFMPKTSDRNVPSETKKNISLVEKVISGDAGSKDKDSAIVNKNGEIRHIRWSSFVLNGKAQDSIGNERSSDIIIVTGVDITMNSLLKRDLKEKESYIKTTTSRLKRYISLDPHTGLLNYRHFIQQLNKIFSGHLNRKKALSLMIMDIDYFCSINNTHGVSVGNQILKEIAILVKKNVGKNAIVARFGGTEFAVLMPGTDAKTAFQVSGKLFLTLSDHNFIELHHNFGVNISLRMAIGGIPHCEDIFTSGQLIDRVMDKLEEAKATGSNSILICSSDETLEREMAGDAQIDICENGYKYTMEFVKALANTVKIKDCYTQEHSVSMSDYAMRIADHMGMKYNGMQSVRYGSLLHDIGKIGIDKMILLKPKALTKTEFSIIRQHPMIGAEIIRNVHPLKAVVPFVLYHHERYDGSGYLNGLKGDEIPLGARIISLADVFQALISDRPYRKALSEENALSIVKSYSGSYFDPKVVKAFFEVYPRTRRPRS